MKNKTKKILILDDNYWFYFFKHLDKKWKYSFSVRGNVIEPSKYYRNFIKNPPDVLILNIWFRTNWYSSPKGIKFLERLIWHYGKKEVEVQKSFFWLFSKEINKGTKVKDLKTKIIIVDDAWKWNKTKFSIFKYFNNIYFVSDKNIDEIHNIIENS